MAKFKPLVDSSVKDAEAEVSKYWKDINILEKTLEKGENDPSYVFYEGPPTANGNPGIHHVVARTLKDWVCRYKTMSGYQVQRKAVTKKLTNRRNITANCRTRLPKERLLCVIRC